MRKRDRQWHELWRLAAGEADHHALVPRALQLERVVLQRALSLFQRMVDARRDVWRLLFQINLDQRVVGVETNLFEVVANAADGVANRSLNVEVGVRGDLADDHAQPFGDGGLAGHAGVGVLREHAVEDRIRDLVANLVRMAFGHRLGGQQERLRGAEGSCHCDRQ